MFLGKFCQTFGLNVEKLNINNLQESKYDFCFYYIDDKEKDNVIVANKDDFYIFYEDAYSNKEKLTTKHLFFGEKEKFVVGIKDNNNIKVYDDIIKNENFKKISITVYIDKDIEEEKKEEPEEKKEENNHIENNLNGKCDKKNNGDVNNDCPCCNCCNCCNCCLNCFKHC